MSPTRADLMRPLRVMRAQRAVPGRRSSPLFGLVLGFLAGVLVAGLAIPEGGGSTISGVNGDADGDLLAPAEEALPAEAGVAAGETAAVAGAQAQAGAAARPGATAGPARAAGQPVQAAGGASAVRGVTDTTIKIGVTLLDVGALRNLGPAYDNGDRRAHFESILAGWKRAGLVPVHGRDVQFVYRTYGVLDAAEQRAACVGLVQDEKVFAVLADSRFQDAGSECVAREMRTPLFASDAPTDEVFARSHPNLFTVQMSESRLLRNFVHWAHNNGHLNGKKIGIYYHNEPVQRQNIERNVKAELARLGYSLAAEATTDQQLGGPQDAVAVQRFRTAGVQVALLFTSKAGFMQQAQAQAYRPQYLDSDFLSGTTNTATSTFPPEHFDGALAMSGLRYGEWKAGIPLTEGMQTCQEDYRRHSGKKIDPHEREGEWNAMNKGCDAARVLLAALDGAGRDLTPASLLAAAERLPEMQMGIAPPIRFAGNRHHGVTQQRTLQWAAACRCWRAAGPFSPLYVP